MFIYLACSLYRQSGRPPPYCLRLLSERTQQVIDLAVEISLTVIDDRIVATAPHLIGRQLAVDPLHGILAGDMVAVHDPADPYLQRRIDKDESIKGHSTVESAVEKYGTLQPRIATLLKVTRHSRMHNVVDGLLVLIRGKQETRQHSLLQLLTLIHAVAHEFPQLVLKDCVSTHQPLGSSIAVIDPYAALGKEATDKTLPTAYASGDRYPFHCCSMR